MKDGDGNYLWQPSAQPGEAPSLMGYPVAESEDMPDIAAGKLIRSPLATSAAAT